MKDEGSPASSFLFCARNKSRTEQALTEKARLNALRPDHSPLLCEDRPHHPGTRSDSAQGKGRRVASTCGPSGWALDPGLAWVPGVHCELGPGRWEAVTPEAVDHAALSRVCHTNRNTLVPRVGLKVSAGLYLHLNQEGFKHSLNQFQLCGLGLLLYF